jgi:DNA polymerase I-like protein with 3'-5' exonuclease and polymerase domains
MHRDALAYDPQGSLSDIVNHGMLNVDRAGDCELLMQNHDSIVIQYPEEREDEIIPKIQAQLRYPVELRYDRTLMIPYGCKTGWNWGDYSEGNPNGLRKYQPGDKRKRG